MLDSEILFSYSKMISEMEQLVKRMVFESYGVGKYYDSHIASTNYLLRTMKYRIPQMGEDNIGAEAHTDKSFFTILHQNGVNGLEIKPKNGDHWLPLQFSPNSFLVMAGDACLVYPLISSFYILLFYFSLKYQFCLQYFNVRSILVFLFLNIQFSSLYFQ